MKLNTHTITQNEKERLLELAAGPDAATAKMAKVVLMIIDGHEVGGIAQTLGVSERTVRRGVGKYNESGVEGLKRRRSPGRTRLISPPEHEALLAMIRRSPEEFGIAARRWNPADLAAIAKREGVIGEVSSWTLRRQLARIIQLEPALETQLHLPGQSRPGAPCGSHNALRHGVYDRGDISNEDHVLIAEFETCLRQAYPDACETEPELIRAAATASLLLDRAWSVNNTEAAERMDRRLRKATQALEAAEENRKTVATPMRTSVDWAADLMRHIKRLESK